MPFDVGDSVPLAWDVKDADGDLVNAGSTVLTITLPDGTDTTPAVGAPAVAGQYRETYVPAVAGRYAWNVVTQNPNTAVGDVFEVRESGSPSLISLADAKGQLKILNTASDDKLREYLEATTEIVESYVGPVVRRTHTARVCGNRSQIPLPHTQVTAITSVTIVRDGTTPITLSDLTINSASGVISYKSGASFAYGDMDIVYTVGRSFVKANWTLAASMIVQHLWETQLGNLPSIQGDTPGYVVTGSGYVVPYRAISLLQVDQVPAGFA